VDYIKVEQIRDQVIAIRPIYSDEGDVSEIIARSGEVLLDRRKIRSVLKGLLHSYGLDIKYQRRLIRERLQRKSVMPCFLSPERVLIPLKMRRAIVAGDCVYGYVDVSSIKDIPSGGKRNCVLLLTNGIILEIMSSKTTVLQIQERGLKLSQLLDQAKESDGNDYSRQMMEWGALLGKTMGEILQHMQRIEQRINFIQREMSQREDETKPAPLTDQ
jgi:hypothetical protein